MTINNLPYSVEVKENYQNTAATSLLIRYKLMNANSVALSAWKALDAVDAGRIDIKADRNGRICFIEANPLAGLTPFIQTFPILARMYGIEYQTLLEMIMKAH